MRKLCWALLIVAMCACAFAALAAVDTYGDREYTINNYNEATLTKYTGALTTIDIPASINGYTVIEVGGYCFYKGMIEEAVIPEA